MDTSEGPRGARLIQVLLQCETHIVTSQAFRVGVEATNCEAFERNRRLKARLEPKCKIFIDCIHFWLESGGVP